MNNQQSIPGVEVPQSVLVVAIRAASHLIAKYIKVFVDGQSVVGVAGRYEVGNRSRRNTQSAENYQNQNLREIFI